MSTFRDFVAVGVGTAIALLYIKPGASKDLPSLTQSEHQVRIHETDVLEYREWTGKEDGGKEALFSTSPATLASPTVQDKPVFINHSSMLTDGEILGRDATINHEHYPHPIPTSTGIEIIAQQQDKGKFAENSHISAVEQLQLQQEHLASLNLSQSITHDRKNSDGHYQLHSQLKDENISLSHPSSGVPHHYSQGEINIVQSPLPTPSVPTLDEQEIPVPEFLEPSTNPSLLLTPKPANPAPEFLNPSANPLLFPTKIEEVEIDITQPITLEQAIELARRNNPQLQAARLTLEREQFALQEALAAEFPSISAIAEFVRADSAQSELQLAETDPRFRQGQDTTSTSFDTRLELNYSAYTAGRRSATIQAARERITLQELEVERLSEELRLNVNRAYYDLQQADAQVEIRQAAVTEAARSLRDTQLLEQAGLGTRFEVLQAQVEVANNNQELTSAISQQRIARRQIAQLLSLPQIVDITTADPIQVAGDWELSLEESIILALKNRAELEQQLVQRNISEQQRRVALAANKPQLSLFARYNILAQLDDEDNIGDGFTLGARLEWDFFDGGAARARANQEATNMAIAESNFTNQRNQVRFEVEQAFFELRANKENIQTAALALEQAEESLRLARLRFQAGVGTQTDVINQQTALTRARVNLLGAIIEYNRALASLQRAISNLPDSNLFNLP